MKVSELFCLSGDPFSEPNSIQFQYKKHRNRIGSGNPVWYSIFEGFGSHLGFPKRSQDVQKMMLKRNENWIFFWRPLETLLFPSRGAQTRQDINFLAGSAECAGRLGRLKEGYGRPGQVDLARRFKICGGKASPIPPTPGPGGRCRRPHEKREFGPQSPFLYKK